jgi:glutamine---fructose-6-phosphate transaminase (isomerizing)
VEEAFPAIVVAPTGKMLPEMQSFIGTLKERGAEVIVISDDAATLALARSPLKLPVTVPEWISPILTIIPGQLFAMHLAYARDFDVDNPRAIRKVTETR